MPHRPLNDGDMALITVMCEDREALCGVRMVQDVFSGVVSHAS